MGNSETVTVETVSGNNCSGEKLKDIELAMEQLEADYEVYAAECTAALRLTLDRIYNLSEAIDRSGNRNPFDRIESRIKTFKSVRGKCKKRECEFTIDSIRENIKDVAGIRIITKYIDEIDLVEDMVKKMPGINIVKIKDYVKEPKKNGYQSLHLDCQVEIYDPYKGSQLIPVEIQLRSKSMNLWATLEHDLKYKNPNPSPEVDAKFLGIAKILREFEEEAIALRDYSENAANNEDARKKLGKSEEKMAELTIAARRIQPMARQKKNQLK